MAARNNSKSVTVKFDQERETKRTWRFAEQGDPAWVIEILNDFLARMTDIIIEYGGTINEFIGDAIFAVYGAPIPHHDHAERAAASALVNRRYR